MNDPLLGAALAELHSAPWQSSPAFKKQPSVQDIMLIPRLAQQDERRAFIGGIEAAVADYLDKVRLSQSQNIFTRPLVLG